MCGIVGYVGRQEAAPILLDGLERLEYRGYDSAGIAVCGDGVLRLCKKKGRVAALRELTHDGGDLPGTLGIGPTRWATHGEPNDVNAHPHMSQSGKFAVVHNGIIENFITLKEELQQKGYVFQSETDTEVVAQLLDYYYSDCGDFFEAMNRLLHAVDGAYALGIICADYPDRLVAARKDAPLLLGFGDGENFIASDVTALIRHTRDIAYMDDGELAILSRSGIRVYDRQLRPVEKKHHHVDWEVDAAEKGGYAHFMLKEIMEQPAAIRKATAARIQGGRVVLQDLTMTPEQIRAMGRIYIVACGASAFCVVGYLFVRSQLRKPYPLLPFDLLRIPIFSLSVFTSICSFVALMLALVALPFFLQKELGYSDVQTGLLLTAWPAVVVVVAPVAGLLVERVHACGKEVHVWTVNKKSELERMKMIGVDNIITDRPILAREVILGEENAENLLARLRALLR